MINKTITHKNKSSAGILAYALIPLAGLATDIYLPSMPNMMHDLNVTEYQIQLTLSVFLISYGIAQIVIGSLLDAFGRYKITLISLIIFMVSSLVIALSHQIWIILSMRIVQGVTAGFVVTAKRVFFVDVYEGETLKHKLSNMTIIWASAPILAPFFGGYLEEALGWQSNFYVLAIYAFILLILELIFSGESILEKNYFHLKRIYHSYMEMLKTPDFIMSILILSFCYGAAMMYSMSGPFIIEHVMHYTPVVTGYASLVLGFSWMFGGIISKKLIHKHPIFKGIRSLVFQAIFSITMMVWGIYCQDLFSMIGLAFLIHICAGFLFNIFFTISLSRFPQYAGTNSGLVGGGLYFLIAFISSISVGIIHPKSEFLLGFAYLIFVLFAAIFLWSWIMKTKAIKNKNKL